MSVASVQNVFQRVETKYLMDENTHNKLLESMAPFVNQDEYGSYTICNIYYDTENFDLIRTSIDKAEYKEKLRLRCYGIPSPDDRVFIEIKKKYDGIVYKRRISLSLDEAETYLTDGKKPASESQILDEINYFISFYRPEPKLFIAYDRTAWYSRDDNTLRITFDHNIRSRNTELELSLGDHGEMLLPPGSYLMEVKTASALPLWLVHILSDLRIYPVSFSKYGNIYKREHSRNQHFYTIREHRFAPAFDDSLILCEKELEKKCSVVF
jgi:hypothetical protein